MSLSDWARLPRLWWYVGNILDESTLLSLTEEPMLDLQGCSIEGEDVQRVLPELELQRRQLLVHFLASELGIEPAEHGFAYLGFVDLELFKCLSRLRPRNTFLPQHSFCGGFERNCSL